MIDTTTETCRSYLSNHIHFFSYLPSTLCIYTPTPQETVYEWLQSLNSCSYNKDKDYFFLRLFSQIAAHEKHRKGCICCRVVYKSDVLAWSHTEQWLCSQTIWICTVTVSLCPGIDWLIGKSEGSVPIWIHVHYLFICAICVCESFHVLSLLLSPGGCGPMKDKK